MLTSVLVETLLKCLTVVLFHLYDIGAEGLMLPLFEILDSVKKVKKHREYIFT